MAILIENAYPVFTDRDGEPLESGFVYIGVENLDPESNPQTVYWDIEAQIPAQQPLRVKSGYIYRNGSPAKIYVATSYSIRVRNKNRTQVYYSASDNTLSTLSIIYSPSFTGAVERPLNERLEDIASVLDFGSALTDATFQTAADSEPEKFIVPQNAYTFSSTVNIGGNAGISFVGEGVDGTTITTSGSAAAFTFSPTVGGGTNVEGPSFESIDFSGTAGVVLNDKTALVTGTMNVPIRWGFDDLRLIGDGTGIGIEITKGFDGKLEGSQIGGFATGLILQGSDLNLVQNNRFTGNIGKDLELVSTGTFGSQNEIRLNQFLGNGASKIFVASCDRHVRMFDNYYEASGAVSGFISVGTSDVTTYGSNTPDEPLSVVIRDNRNDGEGQATNFIRKIRAPNARLIRIEDVPATGDFTSLDPASFFTTDGTTADTFSPLFVGSGQPIYRYIEDETFGPDWHNFRPRTAIDSGPRGGFKIDASNTLAIRYNVTGALGLARQRGHEIILPSGNTNADIGIRPGGLIPTAVNQVNKYFANNTRYVGVITARTSNSGGDTLQLQVAGQTNTGSSFGTTFQSFTLTDQYQAFPIDSFDGYPENYRQVGFNLRTTTGVGDIYIRSIEWWPVTQVNGDPTITFATPGNLSVTYSLQESNYHQDEDGWVTFAFQLDTSTFTHTTASGNLRIALPIIPTGPANAFYHGSIEFAGINKAGFDQLTMRTKQGEQFIVLTASTLGGGARSNVTAADMPSGGSISLGGTIKYYAGNMLT